MERNKVFYLRRFQEKPKKAYILLMGVNVLREIISYLTYAEFIDFCMASKKFFKFLDDKYLVHKNPEFKLLYNEENQATRLVVERKLVEMLRRDMYPAVNVEWKQFEICFFHFVIFDSRSLVFIFHQNVLEIKELLQFSTDLRPTVSKQFSEQILFAKGYKNSVVFAFRTRAEQIILSGSNIILNEDDFASENSSFLYPKDEKAPICIEYLNCGKNVLIGFKNSIFLLTQKMKLLNIHRFGNDFYKLVIPSLQGKSYIRYADSEILIFKINSSQEVRISVERKIEHLVPCHFNNAPQLLYCNDIGYIFLNKVKLKLRCEGNKFHVEKEYLIYTDYSIRNQVIIYDLLQKKVVYQFRLESYTVPDFINCSAFKILYIEEGKVFLHSFLTEKSYKLPIPFTSIFSATFINQRLFIAGSTGPNSGLIIFDCTREIPFPTLEQALTPPIKGEI